MIKTIDTLIIITFATLLISTSIAQSQDVFNSTQILRQKNPHILSEKPSIAVCGKNIHIVWNNWPNEFESQIEYIKSTDNGKTWSNITTLTTSNNTAIYPKIAVYKNNVYVIWKDCRNGNPELYFKKSTDNGETWSNDTRLTYDDPRSTNIYDFNIKTVENNLYIVWKDYRSGSSEIFFKKSTDNGETWSNDTRLTYDYTPSYNPNFYVENNNIYIVWEDWGKRSNICFMMSDDDGSSWTKKTYLTKDTNKGDSESPHIASWDKNIYVVWQDSRDGNTEIYFKKSTDNGEAWSNDTRLTYNNASSFNPNIAVYNQTIYVIWQDNRNGKTQLYLKKSIDGGETWSNDTRLTYNNKANSYDLSITLQGENLYYVWQNYYSGYGAEICYNCIYSNLPTITEFNISKTSITPPGSITIIINGMDNKYNNSELTCLLKYKPYDNNTWKTINTTFTNNHWTADIYFDSNTKPGVYIIRATLINPSNVKTTQTRNIKIITKNNIKTPGFETLTLLISICLLTEILRRKKHE